MTDSLYIVPTRGRPHNAYELLRSWEDTGTEADLLLAVDDDDLELEGYEEVFRSAVAAGMTGVRLIPGPRMRLGPTLNHYVEPPRTTVQDYKVIGFMGDDHRPRTPGWDKRIEEAMSAMGGTGLVYGNDLLQKEALPTAVAISSDIIASLGYMVPPGAIHLYLDNFWLYLGQELGRLTYLPDVVIEHMHPVAGKAQMDERYAEVNAGEVYEADREVFTAWKRDAAPGALLRLRDLL